MTNYLFNNGVRKNPFSIAPDPSLFYFSEQHVECLQILENAIRLRSGLSVVLGDIGTGKTTIGRILIRLFQDRHDFEFRMILDPQFSDEREFLSHLHHLFEVRSDAESVLAYREALQNFLFFRNLNEKKFPVLIIDEGQKLTTGMLEILRGLLNYETNEHKLIQIVILGQLELSHTLRDIPNLRDRIAASYTLVPMKENELSQMIAHRLKRCGHPDIGDVFTDDALRRVYLDSKGYPRKAITLCQQAYLAAQRAGCRLIQEDNLIRQTRLREALYA